ncbi:MAG: GNAT family N-acetyltransferase [Patescibacteria group bacterium]
MKKIPAPKLDFNTYVARPETHWIEREPFDSFTSIYGSGYLPYSGTKGLQNIFYSARSARVALNDFELTSENRRIAKKFDGQFIKQRIPLKEFRITPEFIDFFVSYFMQRHGPCVMPRERLELILSCGLVSTVVTYAKDSRPIGYVLEVEDADMAHYWYSAYDLSLIRQSLGLWLMGDCVSDAKERGLAHYYLGTVYGEKALYKTNFEPLEWWDGKGWNSDIKILKEISRAEN